MRIVDNEGLRRDMFLGRNGRLIVYSDPFAAGNLIANSANGRTFWAVRNGASLN